MSELLRVTAEGWIKPETDIAVSAARTATVPEFPRPVPIPWCVSFDRRLTLYVDHRADVERLRDALTAALDEHPGTP